MFQKDLELLSLQWVKHTLCCHGLSKLIAHYRTDAYYWHFIISNLCGGSPRHSRHNNFTLLTNVAIFFHKAILAKGKRLAVFADSSNYSDTLPVLHSYPSSFVLSLNMFRGTAKHLGGGEY